MKTLSFTLRIASFPALLLGIVSMAPPLTGQPSGPTRHTPVPAGPGLIGVKTHTRSASINAHSLFYIKNLKPDDRNVSPVAFSAALESLSTGAAMQRSSRDPLNLTGDGGTNSFLVLSTANVAGLNGAFYKTELTIMPRWRTSQIKVSMFAVPNNTNPLSNRGAVVGGTYTLEGGHIYTWDNILDHLGLSGAGYLLVGVDSSTYNSSAFTMNAWANTYTAAPAGGFYRTPVPVFTDASLFASDSYCHPNVSQDARNRNNIVLYNIDTTQSLTINIYFALWDSSTWGNGVAVTLAPGESRQMSLSSLFPSVIGEGELYFAPGSGGSWLGYVVRTDNGTNDGLLELPYRDTYDYWPN